MGKFTHKEIFFNILWNINYKLQAIRQRMSLYFLINIKIPYWLHQDDWPQNIQNIVKVLSAEYSE